MFKQISHESEGCAPPHIICLYIRTKLLLTKPTEGRNFTYFKEKRVEDCVIQLEIQASNLVTLSLYELLQEILINLWHWNCTLNYPYNP